MEKKSAIANASLSLLQAFAAAASHRSFAQAARELGRSSSAVTKSVQRLERQLHLRLFHRTTRRVALTQEGEMLYGRCRRVLEELGELSRLAAGTAGVPAGVLRVSVPVTYGKKVVLPALARLAAQHPELRFEAQLSDRFVDLIGAGLDAVVRIGAVADSGLVARKVDEQQLRVYGAPGYLQRKGRPRGPSDLAAHDCVVFQMLSSRRLRPWEFRARGRPLMLPAVPNYVVDDGEGLVSAACAGLGLIQVPDHLARDAVKAGALEEVLASYRTPAEPISLLFPAQRQVPMRLRLFIDALREGSAGR